MINLKEKIKSFQKNCLIAEKIEFENENSILTSMTGGIFWGHKDESWPVFNSTPLVPILSILTSELPIKIHHLENIQLINIFAYEKSAPIGIKNGSVIIRTYSDIRNLEPLDKPNDSVKPCFRIKWKVVLDYQNGMQLEQSLNSEEYDLYLANIENFSKEFPNHSGIKIGGWPYLIQETYFLQFEEPEYVFQFDSNEVFMFCDSGLGYFLKSEKHEWHSHWDTM